MAVNDPAADGEAGPTVVGPVPLLEAHDRFEELVEQVATDRTRVVVAGADGHPAVVLVHPDELATIEDVIELLRDADAVARIRAARAEAAAGDVTDVEEIRHRYQ